MLSTLLNSSRNIARSLGLLPVLKRSELLRSIYIRATTVASSPDHDRAVAAWDAARQGTKLHVGEAGILSFLTTAWDTPPDYLAVLSDSLLNQEPAQAYEWVLLDNGSRDAETIAMLRRLSGHPAVRFHRVNDNLGIIRGMRYCLEQARGRYIVPIDSDDYLHPNAVASILRALRANGFPPLLYSDEDHLYEGLFCRPYLKPDWDPVLFSISAFIAHLGIINRQEALRLGVYTDTQVEGSHDWDTFTRFLVAGMEPVHIPEVLYSWREHTQSTSFNMASKPYVYNSQLTVIRRLVEGLGHGDRFTVEASPLFDNTPDWRIRRKPEHPVPLSSIIVTEEGVSSCPVPALAPDYGPHRQEIVPRERLLPRLREICAEMAAEGGLVHLFRRDLKLLGDDWAWEALGMMEIFQDVVIVGGRITGPNGRIVDGGQVFGFGDGCACPDVNREFHDPGYNAQLWKPHSADAVGFNHAVIDAAFLLQALDAHAQQPVSPELLGAWCCAYAARQGRRVVYTPFLWAQQHSESQHKVSPAERDAFLREYWDLMPSDRYYPRNLRLEKTRGYNYDLSGGRAAHLATLRRLAENS